MTRLAWRLFWISLSCARFRPSFSHLREWSSRLLFPQIGIPSQCQPSPGSCLHICQVRPSKWWQNSCLSNYWNVHDSQKKKKKNKQLRSVCTLSSGLVRCPAASSPSAAGNVTLSAPACVCPGASLGPKQPNMCCTHSGCSVCWQRR